MARQCSEPPLTVDDWLHVLSFEKLVLDPSEPESSVQATTHVDGVAPKASRSCMLLLGHLGRFERAVGSSDNLVRLSRIPPRFFL